MSNIYASINTRVTPQTQQARPDQVVNNAGGHVFEVTPLTRLRRFLTLGTESGSYYVGAAELTKDNATVVMDMARNDTITLVQEIVAISTAGRAPRQQPALFALAAAASLGDDIGRAHALGALRHVARTGTHLFLFATYIEQFRGWGRALRRAVGNWYLNKPVDQITYQAVKYRQRDGWSHRDLLRLSHPETDDPARKALFDWICGRHLDIAQLPLVEGFTRAQIAPAKVLPDVIRQYGLTWEMLPSDALNDVAVWDALLDNGMPQTALIRQLPRLTKLGMLSPLGPRTGKVAEQLADPDRLAKARVHPMNLLVAHRTYASGRSTMGKGEWSPVARITDALDAAFYQAFGNVESTGKRTLLALDVSGSMGAMIGGMPLSAREASTAMALVTAATEPAHEIVGFTSSGGRGFYGLTPLDISPRQRLGDAVAAVSRLPFGGTDCALPMLYATETNTVVDTFVIFTDSETWHGAIHPFQAMRDYRAKVNPAARLAVVGMTSTGFSIADPTDAGMLDVAGFDTAVPNLLADFSAGRV
ncbi:TROVE domain-containing protein [Nocardia fluminea]|uniref:TROVE domain-containing protein n=1 Tax=Nocardia fluminea TaxID=134984 RepID=UPI00365B2D4D